MKKLFFLLLSSLLLTACMGKEVQTEVIVEGVDLSENTDLTLKFFLKRSDLGLYETDYRKWHEEFGGYVFDPPDELLAKFIYLSGVEDRTLDGGVYCSEYFYPHDCEVTLNQTQPYLVKVTYENGDYSFTEVTVPIPDFLEELNIVSPSATPEQDSNFEISFEDIGADEYTVSVANCDVYNNDGINPCLNESTYTLVMADGVPEIFLYDWEEESVYQPYVEINNGIITLKSNFKIDYQDIVKYDVEARVKTETGISSISDSVEFEKL